MSPASPRVVLLTGGTGFIGRYLCQILISRGWQVVLWRHRSAVPAALRGVESIATLAEIPPERPIDAVVNLAGARILGLPWTKTRRRTLVESRVGTTDSLVRWMAQRTVPPAVMVSASAVGFYGVRGSERVDESAQPQPVFQSEICRLWEEAALRCMDWNVRCVLLRFGVVLGADGGALPAFARPARMGLAAVMGTGRQGFPWIHIEDAVGLILWALSENIEGAVNAVAPHRVSQREFQSTLCAVLHRRLLLRVPAWPVRLALGEMSQLLVDGQYVEPARALRAGYAFRHPDLRDALTDLLGMQAIRQAEKR
jgi:uncharacterized protein (TIGR01777 family)